MKLYEIKGFFFGRLIDFQKGFPEADERTIYQMAFEKDLEVEVQWIH